MNYNKSQINYQKQVYFNTVQFLIQSFNAAPTYNYSEPKTSSTAQIKPTQIKKNTRQQNLFMLHCMLGTFIVGYNGAKGPP